jgi:hypothetical protein
MYKFINRVIEIKNILNHLWLIDTVLDIVIILLTGFLFIPYIGISPYWIIIPIFLYIVVSSRYNFKKNIVALIEEKYPELNERLRTVYDNKESENVVLETLAESVLTDIEKIKYSSFFETKKLGMRIAIIFLLVTFLISTSIINPMHNEPKNDFTTISSPLAGNLNSKSMSSEGNIFDEPSFVSVANDSRGLIVNRGSGSELNVPGTEKKTPSIYPSFPQDEDFTSTSSQAYSEAVPVIYQQIVKNYFMNISRE